MYHRQLKEMLKRHEGTVKNKAGRHVVYDDKTGCSLKKGDKIHGHPTIGWGINLEGLGIDDKQAEVLLMEQIFVVYKECTMAFPTFRRLSRVRQDVIASMAFNMGVKGLKAFKNMWASIAVALVLDNEAARAEEFKHVARHMLDSKWHSDVGTRAEELAEMMEKDEYVKGGPDA